MSKPLLYHNPVSCPSWAVRMLAARIGLQLDTAEIDFVAKGHKEPAYLKINPMGTIPTLKDGDFTISESHTIMMYLLKKYGQQHLEELYPSEIRARALVDQAMYFDTGVAFIRVKLIALPALFEDLDSISPQLEQQILDVYGIMEAYLTRSRYAAADHLTIADLSLGGTVVTLQKFVRIDASRYPRCIKWLEALSGDKYFKEIAIPGVEALEKGIRGCMARNLERNKNKL